MGRGNFWSRGGQVYIEPDIEGEVQYRLEEQIEQFKRGDICKEEMADEDSIRGMVFSDDIFYDMFREDIEQTLCDICSPKNGFVECNRWDDDVQWVLENSYCRVGLADNQWSLAICFDTNDDCYCYDVDDTRFIRSRNRIVKELYKFYSGRLFIRNRPWCSSKVSKDFITNPQFT